MTNLVNEDYHLPQSLFEIVDGKGSFVLNGASASDWAGNRVDRAGDVNGDGIG